MKGRFADFAKDPHADPGLSRAPCVEAVDVAIIGGGFGGLLAGGRLREAGVESLRIIDKAADFGGTWYWNRYPGVACDVESYVYLPFLEETGYIPSEKYARGGEIFEHCRRIGRHYRLYDGALFQTEVTRVAWDETGKRWIVSTDRGDRIAARFVVSCKGLYNSPKLPGIPGIEDFQGRSFHTSRWDYAYTGGAADQDLAGLEDKAVGIIGTGSTGIQCVPRLAERSKHLYVFQRTPSSIDARNNRPTDPAWAATLSPGWHRRRIENFTLVTAGVPQAEDLVEDSWTDLLGAGAGAADGEAKPLDPAALDRSQFMKMEVVRRRVEAVVKDRATAEALKPYYHYLCKRPGFSDEYLEAFNRPNVTLVDTDGRGVERITPHGVVAGGAEYRLDCLIFATGFDFMNNYVREAGFDVIGRGGLALSECWAGGVRTLFGMQAHGFPNFFVVSLIQAGVSFNYMHIADEQARHIAYVISRCLEARIETAEPAAEAVSDWVETVLASAGARRAFLDGCTPGYIDQEGRRDSAFDLNASYPKGPVSYLELLESWRAEGSMQGLVVEPAGC